MRAARLVRFQPAVEAKVVLWLDLWVSGTEVCSLRYCRLVAYSGDENLWRVWSIRPRGGAPLVVADVMTSKNWNRVSEALSVLTDDD